MLLEDVFNRDRAAEEKSRRAALVARLAPYRNRDDIYISMRGINKVGINPTLRHTTTPMGIYTYQLTDQIFDEVISRRLPYLAFEKYIAVIQGSPEGQLRSSDDEYCRKLLEQMPNPTKKSRDVAIRERPLASNLRKVTPFLEVLVRSNALAFDVVGTTEYNSQVCVKWSSILRRMGLQSLRDDNTGSIFNIEPTQTVFFSIKPIKVLEIIRNKSDIYHREINSLRQIEQVLKILPARRRLMWLVRVILDGDIPDLSEETGNDQLPASVNPNIRFSRIQVGDMMKRLGIRPDDEMQEWLDGAPTAFYEIDGRE